MSEFMCIAVRMTTIQSNSSLFQDFFDSLNSHIVYFCNVSAGERRT